MGFAASVSSSASSGFLSASSAFARGTTPWLAPLANWLQRHAPERRAAPRQACPGPLSSSGVAGRGVTQVQPRLADAPPRPLRVLRVVDGAPRQCAGRMVISGRMADVCAELDRLAAREVQRQAPVHAGPAGGIHHAIN